MTMVEGLIEFTNMFSKGHNVEFVTMEVYHLHFQNDLIDVYFFRKVLGHFWNVNEIFG
jgi:hypothetical protein